MIWLVALLLIGHAVAVSVLSEGDLVIVGVNSDDPDQVRILTLVPLDEGATFSLTDNGYTTPTGGALRDTEGVLTYTVPLGGHAAGTVISYDNPPSGQWTVTDGTPLLSASGDQVFLFQGAATSPTFIFGIHFAGTSWDVAGVDSGTSALPASLSVANVAVGSQDNYMYTGPKTGTTASLLAAVTDVSNWSGNNNVLDLTGVSSGFSVVASTSAPSGAPSASPLAPPPVVSMRAVRNDPDTIGIVRIEGVVTNDMRSSGRSGFFMQMTAAAAAVDPLSGPEGLFVYCGGGCSGGGVVAFAEGDLIQVVGNGTEFGGNPQLVAYNLGPGNVFVLSTARSAEIVPGLFFAAAVNVPTLTLPPADRDAAYTPVSDMLVRFSHSLTVTDSYDLKYGTLAVSQGGRLIAATMTVDPGPAAVTAEELNDRRALLLDDADSRICPVPQLWPVTGATPVRLGYEIPQTALAAAALLRFDFDAWTLLPTVRGRDRIINGWDTSKSPRVRDISPFVPANAPGAGRVRVASLNMENYFSTLGCADCRGADNAAEWERQRTKLFLSIQELDAAIFGLQEVENNGDITLAQLVLDLNAFLGAPGKYAHVATGSTGTDVIKSAIIYQPALVSLLGSHAVLEYDNPVNKSRPSVAQSFKVLNAADAEAFTVVVQHFKSKGSDCEEDDPPTSDRLEGEGSCGFARLTHANQLLAWLDAGNPTGVSTDRYALLGDFNAHVKDRALTAFTSAGYVDLASRDIPNPRSYTFGGRSSTLDYFLASPSMAVLCSDTYEWHINADESLLGDYKDYQYTWPSVCDTKPPSYFDATTPFRGSDHDPLVASCAFNVPTAAPTAKPTAAEPAESGFPGGVAAGVGGGVALVALVAVAAFLITRRRARLAGSGGYSGVSERKAKSRHAIVDAYAASQPQFSQPYGAVPPPPGFHNSGY